MRLHRLPRPLRVAVYGLAVAVLLWLCLAPGDELPDVGGLSDKVQHATAWLVLTALGLILAPRRPRGIAMFALGLGIAVEILQGAMGFGRDSDWRDVVADSIGVAVALLIYAAVRGIRR